MKGNFSEATIEAIKEEYYVYALVDPRDNKPFYIGKGTGNRVFSHVAQAEKQNDNCTDKINKIQEIRNAGEEVKHYILHWGLTEEEAFASEAALINLLTCNEIGLECGLSNIQGGHHSSGCKTAEDFDELYSKENIELANCPGCLIIKVNKLYRSGMTEEEVYDIVRGVWRIDKKNRCDIKCVIGVYKGIVVGAYIPTEWKIVRDCKQEEWPENIKNIKKDDQNKDYKRISQRVFFTKKDILDNEEKGLIEKYQNKIIKMTDSRNPIRYGGKK